MSNLSLPVFEETISYIKGDIAIDNPIINVYRLLRRRNAEWVPEYEGVSMNDIRSYLNQQKKTIDWECRFFWVINNQDKLVGKSIDEIIKMADLMTI